MESSVVDHVQIPERKSPAEIELTRSEKFCVSSRKASSLSKEKKKATFTQPNPPKPKQRVCDICFSNIYNNSLPLTTKCSHHDYCDNCQREYVETRFEMGIVEIPCPETDCSEEWSCDDIKRIINDEYTFKSYEKFLLVSTLSKIPELRWCPGPDCEYAVIAGESCDPQLKCQRLECRMEFCYSCRRRWHPNETCLQAMHSRGDDPRRVRSVENFLPLPKRLYFIKRKCKKKEIVKPCPGCSSLVTKIVKDEACNHMTCPTCATHFCWLCMKKIDDMELHFQGPMSSCQIYGDGLTRRQTVRNTTATLLLAPFGIGLAAALGIPALIGTLPYLFGKKLYKKYKMSNKHKRNVIVTSGVTLAAVASPIISTLAVGLGVPVAFGYVYGVMPLSNCLKPELNFDDESDRIATNAVNNTD